MIHTVLCGTTAVTTTTTVVVVVVVAAATTTNTSIDYAIYTLLNAYACKRIHTLTLSVLYVHSIDWLKLKTRRRRGNHFWPPIFIEKYRVRAHIRRKANAPSAQQISVWKKNISSASRIKNYTDAYRFVGFEIYVIWFVCMFLFCCVWW